MYDVSHVFDNKWLNCSFSSITLKGEDCMDHVISRNAWFWTLSNVYIADVVVSTTCVDPYSRSSRIVPMYTLFKTASSTHY